MRPDQAREGFASLFEVGELVVAFAACGEEDDVAWLGDGFGDGDGAGEIGALVDDQGVGQCVSADFGGDFWAFFSYAEGGFGSRGEGFTHLGDGEAF